MMSEDLINVKIKLFAIYQEVYNSPEMELQLSSSTTVGDLLEQLINQKPQLSKWRDVTRFGVNLKFVDANTVLHDGDVVVLIPPVSGG